MCFVWISEQTAIISLYSINWLVFITETERVYCAVRTGSLTFSNSTFCPHSVFMCFVWISEQTAIISLYSINWLVFITETQCVYCAVRDESLNITDVSRRCAECNQTPDINGRRKSEECRIHRCCQKIRNDWLWMWWYQGSDTHQHTQRQTYQGNDHNVLKNACNKLGVGSCYLLPSLAQQPTCLPNIAVWSSICLSDGLMWWRRF
jgi:hypothetical protein